VTYRACAVTVAAVMWMAAACGRTSDDTSAAARAAPDEGPARAAERGAVAAETLDQEAAVDVEVLLDRVVRDEGRSGALETLLTLGAHERVIEVLEELLRSERQDDRLFGRANLVRLRVPIQVDRYTTEQRAPYPNDRFTVIDAAAEVDGATVVVSWQIHFGADLLAGDSPQGRIEVTVAGAAPDAGITRTFPAQAGGNTASRERLADGLAPGAYHVSVHLHAESERDERMFRYDQNHEGLLVVEVAPPR
jgi:hypothetical protein